MTKRMQGKSLPSRLLLWHFAPRTACLVALLAGWLLGCLAADWEGGRGAPWAAGLLGSERSGSE